MGNMTINCKSPKITRSMWGRYTVEGVPGEYTTTNIGSFTRIRYRNEQGRLREIGRVPMGSYSSEGIEGRPNYRWQEQVDGKILNHAQSIAAAH